MTHNRPNPSHADRPYLHREARRAVVFAETERGQGANEEPYSCTATTPDAGIAKVSTKNTAFLRDRFVLGGALGGCMLGPDAMRRTRTHSQSVVFASLALFACGGAPPAKPPVAEGAPVQRTSTVADRKEVAITVYNGDFGLVREVREVDLGEGRISLEYRDVSSQVEPQTVTIKSLLPQKDDDPASMSVLEQNYRYDLLSPEKLLEKYEGKEIKVYRWNKESGKDEEHTATVLSTKHGTILKMGNEITYGFPGRFSFPEVPTNLISKPSLVWLVDSRAKAQKMEVTYLTRGLGWQADYVVTIGDEAANSNTSKADLSGWVTLNNRTGTSYENANLKLVAGDVRRVVSNARGNDYGGGKAPTEPGREGFREESFFEYHLYPLDRPTNLLDNEQKQVSLLASRSVEVQRTLRFFGQESWYRGQYGQLQSNQKVGVYLSIDNTEKNNLGTALPKGTIRVYKADKSGQKQFIGEDAIDHTPRDEKVKIKVGESFDVVGDRKQMSYRVISTCISESDWEISLRNHKDTADTVTVVEPIGGDWEILANSLPFHKEDANTFTFEPKVPSRGNVKVTYTVRVKWC